MLFQQAARILLYKGVEVLVCRGKGIERIRVECEVAGGLGEGEDVEEDLGR